MEAASATARAAHVVSRRLVRPASNGEQRPSEPKTVHLTPWDLKLITIDYLQMGVVLPAPPGQVLSVVDELASSFARALARFYPLAGRLAVTERGDVTDTPLPCFSISLRCTDEGAEFVHATAPAVAVADVVKPLYIPRDVVWSFFPLSEVLSTDAATGSLPVLAAQVTELAGGVFVAVSLSHGVADATTFWHFFNTWSEMNRGKEISTPAPVLERWFPETCPAPIPLPFGKLENIVRRIDSPPLEECFFSFSAESVNRLKAKSNAEMAGTATSTISSLQSLFAYLWRAVSRARGLAPSQETTLTMIAGCRGRMEAIPDAYVGNAFTYCKARATAGDVADKGLGWTAWLLNRTVANFDEVAVERSNAEWARKPRFARIGWYSPVAVTMGNSQRFDVYGNDFGWGRPVAVRSGGGDKADGRVTVYQGREGGGSIAMEVCLAPDAAGRRRGVHGRGGRGMTCGACVYRGRKGLLFMFRVCSVTPESVIQLRFV